MGSTINLHYTNFKLPPFDYSQKETRVAVGMHLDRSPALLLVDAHTYEPTMKCTVFIGDSSRDTPAHVWIKTWFENKGLAAALVNAGVVELTYDFAPCGFKYAFGAKLTQKFIDSLPERLKKQLNLD